MAETGQNSQNLRTRSKLAQNGQNWPTQPKLAQNAIIGQMGGNWPKLANTAKIESQEARGASN